MEKIVGQLRQPDTRQFFFGNLHRGQIRFRKIAVVIGRFLHPHAFGFSGFGDKRTGLLHHLRAGTQDTGLTPDLILSGPL
ncbi:hypothetical protein D9M70_563230 [compost metagenome]